MSADPGDGAARFRIERDLDINLMVVAGAGTGKTTALVGRILALVRAGEVPLRQMAAITFTEAAAAELRQQIRRAVAAAADAGDERMITARAEVDDAAICTLHSFAERILVEQCVEAGLTPGFVVLDDTAATADFEVRWNRYGDLLLDDPGAERALVLGFAAGLRHANLAAVARHLHAHWDRLEDGGLEYLRRARTCDGHWPSTDPGPVIAALERARDSLGWCTDDQDRLALHLGGTVTDAVALLRAARPEVPAVLQLLDTLPSFRCAQGRQENWTGHVAEVRAACAEAEQTRLDLLDGVRRAVLGDLVARLATFTVAAAEERRREGRLTFHDLLVHARRLVRADSEGLAVLRRRYRRLLIDEFQDTDPIQVELAARLVAAVDGSSGMGGARPGALFVVGDPQQSIYRFRRADIELFDAVGTEIGSTVVLQTNFRSVTGIVRFVNALFDEIFGAAAPGQAAHHALHPVRRAPAATGTGAADGGRAPGGGVVQLTFDGIDDPGLAAAGDAAPATIGSPAEAGPVPVVVVGGAVAGSASEVRRRAARDAATVIGQMVGAGWLVQDTDRETHRPVRWADIAVLIPARSSLSALEEAFEEAGVPYRLEGAALLWGAQEVGEVLAVLRAADDPGDAVAVLAALRSPGLACGDDDLVTWHGAGGTWDPRAVPPPGLEAHPVAGAMAVLDRLHRRRWWSEPSALVGAAYRELRSFELALAHRRPRDHWHRLRWLQDQARLFDEAPGGTMRDFLTWADLRAAGDGRIGGVGPPDPDDDAVRVMTVHGAKGLEFPVVVLAGLERDQADGPPPAVLWADHHVPEIRIGPFRTAGFEQAALREQRLDVLEQHRLLYVSMTRARDHLVVCLHHKQRTKGPEASLGALVARICARNPSLWRGLPHVVTTDGTVAGGDGDGAGDHGGRSMESGSRATERPPVATVPLPAHWEADRVRLLAALRRRPVTTATAVARHGAPGPGATGPVGVAGPVGAAGRVGPDRPDSPRTGWEAPDRRRRVGRAVHGALADLDLATRCDAAGRVVHEVARDRAATEGVSAHASEVATMVGRALTSPTVARAASRRHWREVSVSAPVAHGGVLEGFVDLLVEDDDGLVVVDYKTDGVPGVGPPATIAADRLQVASSAVALESSTGLPVARCVLVFVDGAEPGEQVIEGRDLADACALARRMADDLVVT